MIDIDKMLNEAERLDKPTAEQAYEYAAGDSVEQESVEEVASDVTEQSEQSEMTEDDSPSASEATVNDDPAPQEPSGTIESEESVPAVEEQPDAPMDDSPQDDAPESIQETQEDSPPDTSDGTELTEDDAPQVAPDNYTPFDAEIGDSDQPAEQNDDAEPPEAAPTAEGDSSPEAPRDIDVGQQPEPSVTEPAVEDSDPSPDVEAAREAPGDPPPSKYQTITHDPITIDEYKAGKFEDDVPSRDDVDRQVEQHSADEQRRGDDLATKLRTELSPMFEGLHHDTISTAREYVEMEMMALAMMRE